MRGRTKTSDRKPKARQQDRKKSSWELPHNLGLFPNGQPRSTPSRWLWLTNPQNLKPEQRAEPQRLEEKFPDLARLADHREALRRIFEDGRVSKPATAVRKLNEWCERGKALGLSALEKFTGTLGNWMERIANYFVARSTNGRTENFNRGLRAILWRARDMSNFTHFRPRVLHAFG